MNGSLTMVNGYQCVFWYTLICCSVDYLFFCVIHQNDQIFTSTVKLSLNHECSKIELMLCGKISHSAAGACLSGFFFAVSCFVSQYSSQGSLKFYLIWPCWCTGVQKNGNKSKLGCGDTPAHHVPHCCDGGQGMLSIAWIMSQVPQKSFTTICVCRSCGECGMPFSGSSWTFSGSSWPGQMVWLKLPPLPLQQEIKHRS